MAHMSLKRSVELIRFAKSQGIQVTAEACPHHFTLTDEAVKTFDTNTKVNPPLRTREDVEAIKAGLKDGTIDCIVTDHAPHTAEEKEMDYDHAPYGMIGLETAVGLTITELVEKGVLSWTQMAERMSAAPARIVGLNNKGIIKEGADADITIIDPEKGLGSAQRRYCLKVKEFAFYRAKIKGRGRRDNLWRKGHVSSIVIYCRYKVMSKKQKVVISVIGGHDIEQRVEQLAHDIGK